MVRVCLTGLTAVCSGFHRGLSPELFRPTNFSSAPTIGQTSPDAAGASRFILLLLRDGTFDRLEGTTERIV
jgi:hypothetical protein